jgi:Na+/H+ antiporter NhaD/arsenite permease-like protein
VGSSGIAAPTIPQLGLHASAPKVLTGRDPGRLSRVHLSAAAEQAWRPFVLVTGLLLIGLVAHHDGLFETGRFLQSLAGPPVVLFAACLLLVAVVTAVLNLDTAVVFLTPVLVHAARGRGIEEEAFLYGTVYMANASSLYLLGPISQTCSS